MGSALHFCAPAVRLWSMFVRLTELTVAWSVHLRPGRRDYSMSLFIRPEPFKPAGLVFARLCLHSAKKKNPNSRTWMRSVILRLHCSALAQMRGVSDTGGVKKICKSRSFHALSMLKWVSCGFPAFLPSFLHSVFPFFVPSFGIKWNPAISWACSLPLNWKYGWAAEWEFSPWASVEHNAGRSVLFLRDYYGQMKWGFFYWWGKFYLNSEMLAPNVRNNWWIL